MELNIWNAQERVSNKIEKISSSQKHLILSLSNRLMSLTVLSVIMPIGIINSAFGQEIKSQSVANNIVKPSQLTLSVDSPEVLGSVISISKIKPGESVVQRENRERAEAEARVRAEAEAKAQAEAQAKAKASRNTVSRERRTYVDPVNFDDIYRKAEQTYGVDARLLRAIHYIETGQSGSTSKTSYAGATGPMQFMPSTWKRNGVDGNGDGVADIYNVEDAVFGAANYLKACGYPDVKKALWSYNPSSSYFHKVTGIAKELGMQIN